MRFFDFLLVFVGLELGFLTVFLSLLDSLLGLIKLTVNEFHVLFPRKDLDWLRATHINVDVDLLWLWLRRSLRSCSSSGLIILLLSKFSLLLVKLLLQLLKLLLLFLKRVVLAL